MLPRQVRRIGDVEREVIDKRYMENSPIWDIIINVRHERFWKIPVTCKTSMPMLEIDVQLGEGFVILLLENKESKYIRTVLLYP